MELVAKTSLIEASAREGQPLRTIAVCIAPGSSLSTALIALEPLRSVNRFFDQPAYEIVFVGPSVAPVTTGIGITVQQEATFDGERAFHMVIVSSAYDRDEAYKRPLRGFLRRQARYGAVLCGLDFGVVFLAEAGLLDGYCATMHWEAIEAVAGRFPRVAVSDEVFVIDRNRLSCGGHLAANDLMLAWLEREEGEKIARFVAADLCYGDTRRAGTRQPNPLSSDPIVRDRRLREAVDLMEAHIEEPVAVPKLAKAVGLSVRQLQNLSQLHFGETLSERYLAIRLSAARNMLMYGDMAVSDIVVATGFNSPSTFARAFRRRFRTTPTRYRKAFIARMARPYFLAGD